MHSISHSYYYSFCQLCGASYWGQQHVCTGNLWGLGYSYFILKSFKIQPHCCFPSYDAWVTECSSFKEKKAGLQPDFVTQQRSFLVTSESLSQGPQIHIMSTFGLHYSTLPEMTYKLTCVLCF